SGSLAKVRSVSRRDDDEVGRGMVGDASGPDGDAEAAESATSEVVSAAGARALGGSTARAIATPTTAMLAERTTFARRRPLGPPACVGMTDGDVGAAAGGRTRAADCHAERGQSFVDKRDRVFGEGDPLCPYPLGPRLRNQADPDLRRREAEDPGRAGQPGADVRPGFVALAHRELIARAEPALGRVSERRLKRLPDVQPGWRTGSAVEVLVGAADCE